MAYLEELLPEFRKGAKIRLQGWNSSCFIFMKNDTVYNQDKKPLGGFEVDSYDVFSDDGWELYQKPIDWNYIGKNKCLCWFGVIGREKQRIGTLRKIVEFGDSYIYYIDEDTGFSACSPVCRDEVTFYEDRKDEEI